jgi:hypothetical protein
MDKTDTIKIDVPTFIRFLELAREEIKDDAPLHIIAEKIVEISKTKVVTMDDYEDIISDIDHSEKEQQLKEIRKLSGIY